MERRSSDPRIPLLTDDEDDEVLGLSAVGDEKKTTSLFLYFVVCVACLGSSSLGVGVVWISPVAPKITSINSTDNPLGHPVTTVELSFTGSLIQIGSILGAVALKGMFDTFGRKRCLSKIHFLTVIAFAALAFSQHIILYFFFLFIIGFLIGGLNVGTPVYISEVTQDHNRGYMCCLIGLFIQIGNLYGYIMGSYFSIEYFTLFCALPNLLFFILSDMFLPESPTYLIIKKRHEEAEDAIQQLVRCDVMTAKNIIKNIEYTIEQTANNTSSRLKYMWTDITARRTFLITAVILLLACIGIPAIMTYLQSIFEESGSNLSDSMSTIIVGVFQIFCFLLASILVNKFGRRPLLIWSTLIICIPYFVVGLYFNLKMYNPSSVASVKWIPLAGIICLIFVADIGLISVAYAYYNEVFSIDIKATAISLLYFISGVITSFSSFMFPILIDTIGLDWIFWIYALIFFAGFVFIFVKVPETRNKNIIEIQRIFADNTPPYINYK
ncbi:facilitated trehalose transporter Tret1-like [Diorhabda carinulata]|uniref:facilitated trehalose transporter Tret1-like n=1 Tax=Diorhabda carinulata TaxID=1163345 RepID=UPI0025A0CED4|nr:facilitated trehalose transporter Tret1-like [Diorhabda carinulata]